MALYDDEVDADGLPPIFARRLDEQEEGTTGSGAVTGNSDIILNTLRVYGTFYAIAIVLFEVLRRRFPKLYSIRSWVPKYKCDISNERYSRFCSWFWKVYNVPEQKIFDQCGMDALCFLRALRFCRNLSILGVINALWLLPVYITAEEAPETAMVTDRFDRCTLANLPPSSIRFFAPVLAIYIMVFYSMYLLSKEFEWYTHWRHKFLSQRSPRNYAVYVYGIPKEFRSSYKLATYFRDCSSESAVLEAHVAMDTPNIEKLQSERKKVVNTLEHAAGVEKRTGKKHYTRRGPLLMEKVETIRGLEQRLRELNSEIPKRIQEVMAVNDRFRSRLVKRKSTKDLLGTIDLEEGSQCSSRGLFIEPTIDENASLEFPELNKNGRASIFRDRTATTLLLNTGDDSDSPVPSGVHSEDEKEEDKIIEEEEEEQEEEDEEEALSDQKLLETVENTMGSGNQQHDDDDDDAFDSRERAFLSVFLPGSEDLLPGYRTNQRNDKPKIAESITAVQTATQEDSIRTIEEMDTSLNLSLNGDDGEVPSTVEHHSEELLLDSSLLMEGSQLGDSYIDVLEPDIEAQDFGTAAVLSENSRNVVSRGDGRPVLGSRQSSLQSSRLSNSSTTSSQNSKGALRTAGKSIARTTSAAKHGFAKGTRVVTKGATRTGKSLTKGALAAGREIGDGIRDAGTTVLKAAKDMQIDKLVQHAGSFVPIVLNKGEGEPRAGGFVVFTNLYTTQTALQMVHHSVPYTMEVQEAPSPGDVFWRNVGMKPKKRRLGRLYSMSASAFLCFFWSIPTAFIASLTSVSTIKEQVPKLGELVDENPWIEEALFQLAPMLLLFLNEVLLPEFLKVFATWEGHVSSVMLEASLFLKLSAFMIIQTFFVSAVSGSIYAELTNMIKSPEKIIDLLSTSLPSQSAYFMQIMFAATFLLQAIELLRLYPLACALVRRFVGPNATKKEREKPWLYIYTLEEPPEFWHAETFAQIQILYVMVLLVYAVIAPFTPCALLLCFVLLEAGYRYQFIHNYPVAFDTGGKLWYTFVQFVLASLLIAELTLAGLLALKQSRFAGPAVGPLIVLTVLFILFINAKHSHVMRFLPTRDCVEIDQANAKAGNTDFTFCKGEYLQPSLRKHRDDPEYEDSDDEN